jgi:hypothetical protein
MGSKGAGGLNLSATAEDPTYHRSLTAPLRFGARFVGHLSRSSSFSRVLLGLLLAVGDSFPVLATPIQPYSPPPTWRLVGASNSAPQTTVLSVDGVSAPRSTIIPVPAAPLGRPLPTESLAEQAVPADAQVAAASIRPPYLIRPGLSGGIPTGFVSSWGDYFFSGSAGTAGKLRGGSPDGSINVGFGLGDATRLVGAELFWGIGSIKKINSNGAFGGALGRVLVNRPDLLVSVAGGVIEAFPYGFEPNPQPTNGYGAVSVALPLRPSDPTFQQVLQVSVGGGGSSFSAIDGTFQASENGFFGAAGVELSPNIGVSVGVSSRSTNMNLSWIPFRTLPIFVNVLGADLFSVTPWGTIGVLSVGWGDTLRTGLVTR